MPEPDHVGLTRFPRPPTEYESYMDEEGIPIHHGFMGFSDVRSLDLGHWDRMGCHGAFIELDGIGNLQGTYLLGLAGGQESNAEHHLYEEIFYVVEGGGTTEVWLDGSATDVVSWQSNSVFTVPMNAWHRHTASEGGDALLLVATNAPPTMHLFQNREFIFGCDFQFTDRFKPESGYYDTTGLGKHPVNLRALNSDTLIPDLTNVEIPLDGQRGASQRHFELEMVGNAYKGWVGEYPPGRYSKAHAHASGAILVCISGSGYTLAWPTSSGIRPWQSGKADTVVRTDYVAGGIVSAAPGGADWFHAHFGASQEPLRVMAFSGGFPKRVSGKPGDEVIENQDMRDGGDTIGYADEDPMIRDIFKAALKETGGSFNMPEELYEPNANP